MDYQGVLGRFTYDNGTDIRNRISAVEAGDYRENRDIINEIVLWKMNRRPAGDRGIDRCHLFIKGDQNPVTGTDG